jgi:esterase FrsA
VYTYSLTPAQEFEDRGIQFTKFGVPAAEVDSLRSTITDMWLEGPGGWVYEWSKLAADYSAKGDHTMASLVYGFARFPCIADQQRVDAQNNQIAEFLKASPTFPIRFERRMITVPYAGKTVDVPVHMYSTTGDYKSVPAHVTSGGVDTYKIDFHASYITQAQVTGATIIASTSQGRPNFDKFRSGGQATKSSWVSSMRPGRSGTARSPTARFRSAETLPHSLG